ncbi:MAG: zinc-ribbon domain-containing protein [Proteobacteria bacterium]|nr:zinc-ribbon domain-containing protein [Pseudomonadota bacterium]MBI3499402.1 zinc-ribbon domain-containing protein [Pseudomonadota bacterium]
MILTCPSCSKRYALASSAVGDEGRKVRCGNCGETWFQAPAEIEEQEPVDVIVPPADAIEPPPLRRGANLPALRGQARSGSGRRGWAALALGAVVLLLGVVLGREPLVAAWPPSARLYEAIGIPVPAPGAGLALREINSERKVEAGTPVLVVMGEIANMSTDVRDVPPLRAALRDSGRHELQSWVFPADTPRLLPGETVHFKSEFANPSAEAVDLTITFSGG